MNEIDLKNNFETKVVINGVPDYRMIIADKNNGFLEILELEIDKFFKEKDRINR